eukprot:CAMPEP_0198662276 /NCGR_PEP_ID=MMETSP1467-20131203/46579_1 /TAXON_ID=1462469 /ORGANISM="unid. sp., Strain CCMP2135" /LENGTH=285 /DNA_ID=CAMNT_0044398753 /DNA_START=29 /DNA_END=886 /DNA_ORIENTATION=+
MCGGYQFDNPSGNPLLLDYTRWPVTRVNMLVNLCRQGEQIVVERLGKFHRVVDTPGFFLAVPLVDRLAYVVDTRERQVEASPPSLVSSDNANVVASGSASIRFVDPEKAAYAAVNPYLAIREAAQVALRKAVGKTTAVAARNGRQKLSELVETELKTQANQLGVKVQGFSLTEFDVIDDDGVIDAVRGASLASASSAQMDAETALSRAKTAADAVRIQAEASADAIKTVAKALDAAGPNATLAAGFVAATTQSDPDLERTLRAMARASPDPSPDDEPAAASSSSE